MKTIAFILTLLSTHSYAVQAYASEVGTVELPVRAIEHNVQEVFPTLMTLIEAKDALAKREYERSYELFSILTKYNPDLDGVRTGLSKSLIALGRPDLAKETLLAADVLSPEMNIIFVQSTAMTLPDQQSIAYLRKNLKANPDRRLWNLLGLKLADQGKAKLASEAFYQAEDLGQKEGVLLNNLGVLAIKTEDFKTAITYLTEAKIYAPENIKFDNNRRLALLLDQQFSEALKDLSTERLAPLLKDAALIAKKEKRPYLENYLRVKAKQTQLTYTP